MHAHDIFFTQYAAIPVRVTRGAWIQKFV
jgi:hypothetical protein